MGGASYSTSYAYTHLGQLWQGPLNGNGAQQQYLYCDSTHPHQLTGLYPIGTSCAGRTGATYTSSTDAWGNVTNRVYNSSNATLSYDSLDDLVQWNAGASSQEWYVYDAGGNRTLRRSTTGSGTTLTVYAFGLEEHVYSSSGVPQSSTYYYTLGGRLIGQRQGSTTQFFLTDELGSVLTTFSATAGGAVVQGNQVYGPYGTSRYSKGSMGTNKGFTGQYADTTGLDYYNARYYDPVVGRFLSADTVQGNGAGMDPYAYVGGNPETFVDPTGRMYAPPPPVGDPGPGCGLYCVGNQGGGVTKGSGCGQACQKFQPCQVGSTCQMNTVVKGTTHHAPVQIGGTTSDWKICGSPCISINIAMPPQTIDVPIETTGVGQGCVTIGLLHGCGGDVSDGGGEEGQSKSNILASDPAGDAVDGGGGSQTTGNSSNPREKYVLDNLDQLVPNHGGSLDDGTIKSGDQVSGYGDRFPQSTPDIETPNSIIEVTGANPDGSVPSKLLPGGRGIRQLLNFARGANGKQIYLLYEGDTSQFSPHLWDFLNDNNIQVIPFTS